MRAATLAIATVLITACGGPSATPSATPLPTASPAPSPSQLPSLAPLVVTSLPDGIAAQMQQVLDQRVASQPTQASVSAAVIVPGHGTWSGASGLADTGTKEAATTETAYAVGSVTKTFTAALVLLLVRDGTIGLDDPAAQWLDQPAATKTNGATVRQLLAQRSGIASYTGTAPLSRDRIWTPTMLLDYIGAPNFAAGAQFEYSNSNYLLLGLIAEHAGGAPLEDQLRRRLIEPYGLQRTFLSGREQVPPPLAHGYGTLTEMTGDLYDGSGNLPNAGLASGAWSAGALASTPDDLARWLYALRSGAVLGDNLTAQMFEGGGPEYGLGIEHNDFPRAGSASGHVGMIPGYVTLAFYMVVSGNIVVVSTNTDVEDLFLVMTELDRIASA